MYFPRGRACAVAQISGGQQTPCLYGTVRFYPMGRSVLIVVDICGLPKSQTGVFGFHIHSGSACTGESFAATGSHYDPSGRPHPEHAGDLPPLFSCDGNAYMAVMTDRFCLQDVIGRTVVIHSMADDFHTQPAGNSGKKIACGVIHTI